MREKEEIGKGVSFKCRFDMGSTVVISDNLLYARRSDPATVAAIMFGGGDAVAYAIVYYDGESRVVVQGDLAVLEKPSTEPYFMCVPKEDVDIGDSAFFIPAYNHTKKHGIVFDVRCGTVVGVKFTASSVFYTIVDSYTGSVFVDVPENNVKTDKEQAKIALAAILSTDCDDDIRRIAKACHEANKVLCEYDGDMSQPSWDDAPEWQKTSAINGVIYHIENPKSKPEDSHNSWLKEKEEGGWVYGEVKDADKKTHPCMIPYQDLPADQKIKDTMFIAVVRALYEGEQTK